MPILMTGCFDKSDHIVSDQYKLLKIYTYEDGIDPRLDNNDNVMAKLHSNMLVNELDGNWIRNAELRQFLSINLERINTKRMEMWKERAANLILEMDVRANQKNWFWKDSRLIITLPAWHSAIKEHLANRVVEYVICYQHPKIAIESMKSLKKKGVWGFKSIRSDKQFYEIYHLYFESLLLWLKTKDDIQIRGIAVDSDEVLFNLPEFSLYNKLRDRFNE
jgi:hypothetical protein